MKMRLKKVASEEKTISAVLINIKVISLKSYFISLSEKITQIYQLVTSYQKYPYKAKKSSGCIR